MTINFNIGDEVDGWIVPHVKDSSVAYAKNGARLEDLDRAMGYVTNWSCAVDGGAHVGIWAAAMAEKFAVVHAFEPAFPTFLCLTGNLQRKKLDKIVAAYDVGLGEKAGFKSIVYSLKQSMHAYMKNGGDQKMNAVMPLDCLDIDPGLIKLDIEGMEVLALRGARETLNRSKPVVIIEYKPFNLMRNNTTFDEGHRILTEAGLKLVFGSESGPDLVYAP